MPQAEAAAWAKRPSAAKKEPGRTDTAALDKFVNGGRGKGVRLNAEIDADLRAKLKAKCALEKREIRDVLTELIEAWVKK
jgi:ParG